MGLVSPEEANRWLKEHYGETLDGKPLFRVVWSTNLTEKRKGTFRDMYGEVLIREVTEIRDCLKYPFAQDRWVLERLTLTPEQIYNIDIFTRYTFEGIHVFQTDKEQYLPLSMEMVEVAMYLALVWGNMKYPERLEYRIEALRKREAAKKEKIRQIIGENQRSPLFFVLE